MNTEHLRKSLKAQWLTYYRDNRDWLTRLGVWVTCEGKRRPSSSFILAVLSTLEPQLVQLFPLIVDLSSNPDRIVMALGLNFNPDEEMEWLSKEEQAASNGRLKMLPSSSNALEISVQPQATRHSEVEVIESPQEPTPVPHTPVSQSSQAQPTPAQPTPAQFPPREDYSPFDGSELETPELETSKMAAPEVPAPEVPAPEAAAPEVAAPEVPASGVNVPSADADSLNPSGSAPEMAAVDTPVVNHAAAVHPSIAQSPSVQNQSNDPGKDPGKDQDKDPGKDQDKDPGKDQSKESPRSKDLTRNDRPSARTKPKGFKPDPNYSKPVANPLARPASVKDVPSQEVPPARPILDSAQLAAGELPKREMAEADEACEGVRRSNSAMRRTRWD